MKRHRTAVVSAFVVVSVVLAAGPAAGGVGTAPAASATAADDPGGTGLGANISSFMQASAAETDSDVGTGMWRAGAENASDDSKPAIIEQRLGTLENRLERLESRSESLDSESAGAPGRAAGVRARALALVDSIDRTNETAAEFGVDANRSRIEDLRTRALAIVEDIDRQGIAPPVPGDGPPVDVGARGGPDRGTDSADDGTPAHTTGNGPPVNATGDGPPSDRGQGTEDPDSGRDGGGEQTPRGNAGGSSNANGGPGSDSDDSGGNDGAGGEQPGGRSD